MELRIEDLHKSFPHGASSLRVLNGVCLEATCGEFVAILGPSGCGKTTLLNILAGLIEPDSGRLLLDGHQVPDYRSHIAYMQQKDLLLPWRTVLDNAILGLELQGLPRQQAHAQAQALLERFGLGGFERAYPHQLSGGMRQRVALVRTLLLQKPIWLLDEPFGALDAMTRSQLHHYLLQAWHDQKATVLFVTHDVEEALVLADRVVVMTARPGRIKAILDVALPRPRHVTDPQFVALKAELLELLHAESLEERVYESS
ncbi:MAG: ABC transporter ATP-binding protein [Candidatus Bipolaricaulota bacterium]|nr:ABC transporter ATP-binding protein [Candidatus Bipolaricaulota bacterium]MDW8031295.1 ABC transporter ATP-binding protein [Candidatus Bipolaricaulota bacterium]